MRLLHRRSLWALLNFIGMAAYLALASKLWVPPGEEGTPGGPGDALFELLTLAPVLVGFVVLNSTALIAILRCSHGAERSDRLIVWTAVAMFWLCTVAYDRHKSFTVVDARYAQTATAEPEA